MVNNAYRKLWIIHLMSSDIISIRNCWKDCHFSQCIFNINSLIKQLLVKAMTSTTISSAKNENSFRNFKPEVATIRMMKTNRKWMSITAEFDPNWKLSDHPDKSGTCLDLIVAVRPWDDLWVRPASRIFQLQHLLLPQQVNDISWW